MSYKLNASQLAIFKRILSNAETDLHVIEGIATEKREEHDGHSEKWLEGDKAEESDTAIGGYETVQEALEQLVSALGEIEGVNE